MTDSEICGAKLRILLYFWPIEDRLKERPGRAGLAMDIKKVFGQNEPLKGFVKTTLPPGITGVQKVALNRKGNALLNEGKVEEARRIFEATGYSDGLSRVGDHYREQKRPLDALRMYWLAPDRTKSEPLVQQLAETIRALLNEGSEDG